MDKHTNLKGMVSRYKTPTMDKHTFLYLDTIPFKLVSLSIVFGFYIWIPFLKGMASRNKNPHNGQTY
jgi:hypothetical protein